ncbi:MAG: hypothetical protein MUP41_06090 [Desulfobacterales bacterium]|nr:hypothetical protein [Desulfobacterales bacterium]
MSKVDLSSLAKKWPSSVVCRQEVRNFSGGIVSDRTLANYDAQGIGPPGRFKIGKKVIYPVDGFVKWLESRAVGTDE